MNKERVIAAVSATLFAIAAPVFSRESSSPARLVGVMDSPGLLTCWYNEKKEYTGADTAQPGVKPGIVKGTQGGDYAYGYTKTGDPQSCPKKLPASPAPKSS